MAEQSYQEQILRLQNEQRKALQQTDDQINQWTKFKSDYEALEKRLYTLPDKVSHDVMVPFGKMAFMPGQLVHTNEILVLLGDNWFAERSAKQAAEIVERRIKSVDVQLEELKKQRKLLEPRQQFTSELHQLSKEGGEVQEIREEYDEEKERGWREAHRKHVRENRKRMKRESENQSNSQQPERPKATSLTDEELWARLDQLENIESERKELLKVGTEAEKKLQSYKFPDFNHSDSGTLADHGLILSDDTDQSDTNDESSYTASDELDSDDDDNVVEGLSKDLEQLVTSKGKLISFSHSKVSRDHTRTESEESSGLSNIGPGDIYSKYISELKPKSIMKKTPSEGKKKIRHKVKTTTVAFDTGSEDEQRKTQIQNFHSKQSMEPAFTTKVVEKPIFGVIPSTQQTASQRPMSKFKARSANQDLDKRDQQSNQKECTNERPVSKFKAQRQMENR